MDQVSNYTRKKTLINNAKPTAEIDISLSHWARWAKTQKNNGLGYSNETRESKLMKHGICLYKDYGVRIPDDSMAEEMEQAICVMPGNLKEVLIKYYLQPGCALQKARELNMGRATYYECLCMAKYWLLGKCS